MMQKRPVNHYRQTYEDQLFEVKNLQDNPRSRQHATHQTLSTPQNRTRSDAKKTNRSEDRITQDNNPDGFSRRSIYNRFANQEVVQVEEDPQEEMDERVGTEPQEFHQQSQQGFQQVDSQSFHSHENAIRSLEDQYQQVWRQNEGLKKQMALLEVSLHNETLTNEEQRAYIEVLKQALEIKMSENGLLGFIRSLKQRSNLTEADLFIELTNIKSLIDSNERDRSINEERTRELYGQLEQLSRINETLKMEKAKSDSENERLARDMNQVLQDLEVLRTETEKLSHEKDSLLDYIEEIRVKYEQVDEENNISKESAVNFESKVHKLQTKAQELADKLAETENRNAHTVQEYEKLNKVHISLQKKFEELHKKHEGLQKQQNVESANILQLTKKLTESQLEYQDLQKEHEDLIANHEELGQNLINFQQLHEDQSVQIDIHMKESDVMALEKNQLIQEVERLREVEREFQETQKELEERDIVLSQHLTQSQGVAMKTDELERLNANLEKDLLQLKNLFEENKTKNEKDRQAKGEEIKSLYQQASDLRIELRSQKEHLHRLEVERDSLESSNKDLHEELEKKQRIIINYLKEINEFKQADEKKQEQLDTKTSQVEKLDSQVRELNAFVEECDHKLKRASDAEKKLAQDLDTITKENKKLKEENSTINQRHDKSKKDLEQAKQAVIEIFRSNGGSSLVNTENIEMSLKLINDQVRDLKRDDESHKKKIENLEHESNRLREENSRLQEKNSRLSDSEIQLTSENRKLKTEVEKLKEDINEQMNKGEHNRIEFEKIREMYERKIREDDKNFKEQAKILEDKVTNLVSQRSALEYILSKYIEVTLNAEINDLLEQARNAHLQICHLDKSKLSIRLNLDVLKSAEKIRERNSPSRALESAKKRDMETLNDNIAEIDGNIQIYEAKKQAIENEVARIMVGERDKHFGFYEYEKQNHQLRAELELLAKENQMIAQARDALEFSYNDLVKGMRRSRVEEKFNPYPDGRSSYLSSARRPPREDNDLYYSTAPK